VLVIADGGADPAWVAADLLSQAEHDVLAAAVLVTDSPVLAERAAAELDRQLASLFRSETARASAERLRRHLVCARILRRPSPWPMKSHPSISK
jgi:histidinol dehydrogenase